MAIGVFLGALRHQHGWTLREVSDRAGVSHGYLSQVERGIIKQPRPDVLQKLAGAYRVDYQVLMAEAGYTGGGGTATEMIVFPGAERLTEKQRHLIQQIINNMIGAA